LQEVRCEGTAKIVGHINPWRPEYRGARVGLTPLLIDFIRRHPGRRIPAIALALSIDSQVDRMREDQRDLWEAVRKA
jgi:hypothetical protein